MKILVAVDFYHGSRKALAFADKIASKFSNRLIILHVIHDPASSPGFYASQKPGKKALRNMDEAAHKMMDDFVKKCLPKNRKADQRIVPGLPTAQVVYLAKKEKVDLIVMGTQGLSGLKRLMIGSVGRPQPVYDRSTPSLPAHSMICSQVPSSMKMPSRVR